jgi:membrane protein YdbS with pleckstrin-like domain
MEDREFILGENEQIVQTIYKHWIAIAPFIFVSGVLAILCLFGIYYIARYQPSLGSVSNTFSLVIIILFVLAFTSIFTFGIIWIWHHNKIILTNENIIDIEQIGLFRKNIANLSLANIQDISIRVEGPIQTMLGYGTVLIQTAGEQENFNLDNIANPYTVEQVIAKLHKDYHKNNSSADPLGKLTDSSL